MGIYIKGMEMPKKCGECHFCHTKNFESWCCPTDREDILFDAIPEWCPLIGVPEPHGRLIDVDMAYQETMVYGEHFRKSVLKVIDNLPTVIESEVEE